MNEIDKSIISEIEKYHAESVGGMRTSLLAAINAGERLTQKKDTLKHGEWTRWIVENLSFDIRTAQRYMKAYEHRDQLKNDTVSHLTAAYRLLEDSVIRVDVEAARKKAQKAAEEYLRLLSAEGRAEKTLRLCIEQADALRKNLPPEDNRELTVKWMDAILENAQKINEAMKVLRPELVAFVESLDLDELCDLDEWTYFQDMVQRGREQGQE